MSMTKKILSVLFTLIISFSFTMPSFASTLPTMPVIVQAAPIAPEIEWSKSLGGSGAESAQSIQQTSDGGYIAVGTSNSINGDVTGNHGGYDYWVMKLDSKGVVAWNKCLGGSRDDHALSIQQTSDGGYIVAGYSGSVDGDVTGNHGSYDYWVVKLDSSGGISWSKSLGGSSEDVAYSIHQTSDGGYIVAGYSYSVNGDVIGNHGGSDGWHSGSDYWVVKLDSSGGISWSKCLGGRGDDHAYSIEQTSDGGYIVAGRSPSLDGDVTGNHGGNDYWVVKLDSSGGISWSKSLGGRGDDFALSIQQTSDGGYIVAGCSLSVDGDVTGNHGSYDYWVVKLDSSGGISWSKCLGGGHGDYATSIQQTSDGGYIVVGYSASVRIHGNFDYWVVKLDSSGGISWSKSLGGSGAESATSIQQTSDGGYIVAGSSDSVDGNVTGNHGGSDYWVVKLKPTTVLVNGVTVEPTKVTVEKGDTVTLTATVSPYGATNQTIDWMSDNTAVATVSEGIVTAVGAGTAVITATTEDGKFTANCTVTVIIPVTGVSIDKTTTTLTAGESATLQATISPYDATNQKINWTSDNPAVATVSNGTVTAVAPGTVNITVTTEDGNFSATCTVTVPISIDIDIKPGSNPNSINLKSKGNVPVAVLCNAMFDVSQIDASSVVFAGALALEIGNELEDVNGDGFMDIVFHFATQDLHLDDNDMQATLSGKTLGGNDFSGSDSVRVLN